MSIKSWFTKRKEARAKETFERGYDYAAGQLLRGVSPEALEQQQADNLVDRNKFDAGVSEALRDWEWARPDAPGVVVSAMSLALEALQKERQAAQGRRDFSMLSIRAIETLEAAFKALRA